MKNLDIRILVREKGLTYKRIAQKIGILKTVKESWQRLKR